MQQHPLVALGQLKAATDFPGAPTLDVAQQHDLPLAGWQRVNGPPKLQLGFARQQPLLRVVAPGARGHVRRPVARPLRVVWRSEALGRDGRSRGIVGWITQRGEWGAARLTPCTPSGAIDEDAKQPGFE